VSETDDLEASRVAALLEAERYGRSLEVLTSTVSTNDDARKALLRGAVDGHTVVADSQSQGRGARGREWISPPGSDLYVSIVARPGLPLYALPPVTLAVGVAVAQTVDHFCIDARAHIKWPNDVLLGGGKVAGVLVESTTLGHDADEPPAIVIGIGLNVRRQSFPTDLDYPATSLALSRPGQPFDRAHVLAVMLRNTEVWVDRLVQQGPKTIVDAVDQRLALRGATVDVEGLVGTVLGVAADGRLRLGTDEGERLATAGRLRPVT